jgi:hypothetical protein
MLTKLHQPVEATYHGTEEGWHSTGLAYEDYSRCATHTHKQSGERRFPTPDWVHDDATVRAVVTLFMEERAQLVQCGASAVRNAREGSEIERVDRAKTRMMEKRPQLEAKLKQLCARYMAESNPTKRKVLAQLIENSDTQIRIIERGASIAVAILHYYFRLGMDSVAVAQELNLKPPHIRQMLYRLKCTHKTIEGIRSGAVRVIPFVPRVQRMGLDAQLRPIPLCVECGQACKEKRNKCCSLKCAWKARRRKAKRPDNFEPKPERLKFCSPTCKEHFTEHPYETLKKRFGIDLDELRKTEGESYASYVVYSARLNQVPMPANVWRLLNGGGC